MTDLSQAPPRVLVAVDGGPDSGTLIDRAVHHFGHEASYLVVSAGSVAPYVTPISPLGVQPAFVWLSDQDRTLVDRTEDAAQEALAASGLDPSDAGDEVEVVALIGPAAQAVVDLARTREVDVIVVGSSGRGWLSRLLEPSVQRSVVDDAPCDVLMVRLSDDEPGTATGAGSSSADRLGSDAAQRT